MILAVNNGPLQYDQAYQVVFTIAYSIIIFISVILGILLKNKSDKVKRIPLYIIGITLVVLEISKQIKNVAGYDYQTFFSFITGERSEFDLWGLPFHFCSLFIFWCLFQLIFMNSKKISILFDNLAFIWATFISVLVIFYPGMVFNAAINGVYQTGKINHTSLFHLLVVLYWGIALSLRTYKFDIKKVYQAPVCVLIYGAFVLPAVHIFKQNYCSLYFPDGWDFLVPIYEKGIVAYDGFLIALGIILITIVYLALLGIEKLRDKVKDNKWYLIGYLLLIAGLIALYFVSKNSGYEKFGEMYAVYLVLVTVICELPATLIGHTKAIISKIKKC